MDEVSQIREKIDIVSFISEYIKLNKAGRNFKANCPFHTESTPSFVVSPERQIWHCFGCQKGGTVYDFLMEYERLEFAEALRILAKRAGVELSSREEASGVTSKKERLYQINSLAREYYHYVLTKHPAGKHALQYLQKRGVDPKVIETFQLGFAPAAGNALVNYLLNKKHYPKEEVVDAGLAFLNGSRAVDFFRGRLIFTLVDHRDNVVGFSGRVLDAENVSSKYINTRETLIYHKGDMLYGLNITKEAIKRENQVIVVEGEFDVLSCFQNGVANTVAVKGTALTENQVNLLARYVQKITFCFDGDKAGQEAIKRSLSVVEAKDLTSTVIEIPNGKDPDEALKKDQALFKKAVREDSSIYDYLFAKVVTEKNVATAEGKKQISEILLPIIAGIKNEIVKEHYIKRLSSELDTSYESISKELARLSVKDIRVVSKAVTKTKRNRDEVMEEYLLALTIQSAHPKPLVEKAMAILGDFLGKERANQKIMHLLRKHFERTEVFHNIKFADNMSEELVQSYNTCLLFPLPLFLDEEKLSQEVGEVAKKLKTAYIQQKMKQLAEEIKQKELKGQEEDTDALKKNYSSLAALLESA